MKEEIAENEAASSDSADGVPLGSPDGRGAVQNGALLGQLHLLHRTYVFPAGLAAIGSGVGEWLSLLLPLGGSELLHGFAEWTLLR